MKRKILVLVFCFTCTAWGNAFDSNTSRGTLDDNGVGISNEVIQLDEVQNLFCELNGSGRYLPSFQGQMIG